MSAGEGQVSAAFRMFSEVAYGTYPTRVRRGRGEMDALRSVILGELAADHPMTVRQLFYRMVSRGVIAKTEAEYKKTVCRLLVEMRLSGDIPFGHVADNTRWQRKPASFSSLEDALRSTAEFYRRALWADQLVYVEVWLEKDALAGVMMEETAPWDVPLMVTRGYPSISYLYEAASAIAACGKPAYLYYLGDHDPSGVDITRNVEQRLRQFAPQAEIHFERLAVKPWQIIEWNLPTRPTKSTDSRSRHFDGDSVEVDAIPAQTLRELVRGAIAQHINGYALQATEAAEQHERLILNRLAEPEVVAEMLSR